MKREQLNLTEEDGYEALKAHVLERALAARAKHGPTFDEATMRRLVADPEVVRFPTRLIFGQDALLPGEFGWARPEGDRPTDGFALVIHPFFEDRWDALPLLIAYHVVSINYLDVATHEEAELFGAALLGLRVEDYYAELCRLADSIPGAPRHDPTIMERFAATHAAEPSPSPGGGGCGSGSCGCDHA